MKELADIYKDDLPSPQNLDMELICWGAKWDNHKGEVPNKPADTVLQCDSNYFPNIATLLRIVCTLPVTSCSCERSISGLKQLKTYLRSTMGQARLNGLELMHFNYGMSIDYEAVLSSCFHKETSS